MVRVNDLELRDMERNGVHAPVRATYTTFQDADGHVFLQIDTYGSAGRKMPDKVSQTLQFGPEGLAALRKIIEAL